MRRAVPLRHLLLVGLALSACTNRSGDDSSSSSSSGTPASSSSGGVVSSGSGTQSSSRANSSGVNSSSRANSSGPATSTGTSNPGSGSSAAGGSSTSTQSSAGGGASSVAGSSNGGVSSSTPGSSSVGGGSSGAGGSSGVVGSSSSGGSSSGLVITTPAEYCAAITDFFCTQPSCTYSGENPARADCLRGYAHACPIFMEQFNAEVDAGLRAFDPAAATSCVNTFFSVYAQVLELGCLDPANPTSNNAVLTAYYGTLNCSGGIPTYQPGLVQGLQGDTNACDRVSPGLVQGAGTCGTNDVCASKSCDNRPDGGCGTCAPVIDAGPPSLRPGNLDEPCIVDAGAVVERPGCVPGLACNDDSDTCEPFLGQDAPCGPGIRGVCSVACGQRCATTPDGGFCKPAAGLGDPCTLQGAPVFCAEGLSCTPGHDDAGIPDFAASRCTPQAMANDSCSPGFTWENYPRVLWPYTGAISYGRLPACAGNLRCNIPEGQPEGLCVPITAAATGQPCDNGLVFNCATRGDRCTDEGDGGRACRPRGLAGATCTANEDCGVNLFCNNGLCAGLRGEGESCESDVECAGASLCAEHACILVEHITAQGWACQ